MTTGIDPEVCARYVPAIVAEHLLSHAGSAPAPGLQSLQGAILFADISGFTALTERCAQAGGDSGAETLTTILNTYFGRLVGVIREHGGDVLKFAGDAMLALWRSEDEAGLSRATAHAAACALAVQAAMRDYRPGDGVTLTLRAAIGTGSIVLAHLGGTRQRWEFLVAGAPLAQVGAISGEAEPGEVLLSADATSLLYDDVRGELLDSGALRLNALRQPPAPRALTSPQWPAGFSQTLRRYIPFAILHRLAAGQTQWLGELRRLTILFVNLPELRHDAPLARMQQIMLALQQALYR
ncbi:MAG TPA: adenylate/guanylate cyclase domain-containing protein, partial [Solimonas sp.]|nr:adenylate/guanylate cyclase domain-containing protein [Solimonas sp.]